MGRYDYLCDSKGYTDDLTSATFNRYNYLCNSEDRSHYNKDYNFATYMTTKKYDRTPPTFVTYNVTVDDSTLHEVYREEIEETVRRLLADASEEQIAIILNEVLNNIENKMQEDIHLSVDAAIEAAFEDFNNVYGGSASEVINEEAETG